jgi:hypothetical protein
MGHQNRRGRPRRIVGETSECTKCGKILPTTKEYFRFRSGRDYPHSWCRVCENEYSKGYFKSEKGRATVDAWKKSESGRASHKAAQLRQNEKHKKLRKTDPNRFASYELKKRIGITLEEKNAKFESQDRKCAICKSEVPNTKNKWFADHCHKLKKFRGVLCGHCNSILGHAGDSVPILFQAILYLVENS